MLYEVKLSIRAQSCAAQVPPLSTCIKETRGAVGVHVVPAGYMNCLCHQSQQLFALNYIFAYPTPYSPDMRFPCSKTGNEQEVLVLICSSLSREFQAAKPANFPTNGLLSK